MKTAIRTIRTIRTILIFSCILLLSSCAHKKPRGYRFTGCVVTRTWSGEDGKERKECDCKGNHVALMQRREK